MKARHSRATAKAAVKMYNGCQPCGNNNSSNRKAAEESQSVSDYTARRVGRSGRGSE